MPDAWRRPGGEVALGFTVREHLSLLSATTLARADFAVKRCGDPIGKDFGKWTITGSGFELTTALCHSLLGGKVLFLCLRGFSSHLSQLLLGLVTSQDAPIFDAPIFDAPILRVQKGRCFLPVVSVPAKQRVTRSESAIR